MRCVILALTFILFRFVSLVVGARGCLVLPKLGSLWETRILRRRVTVSGLDVLIAWGKVVSSSWSGVPLGGWMFLTVHRGGLEPAGLSLYI